MTLSQKIRIAISQGDPAGIGPELAVKCAIQFASQADITLFGAKDIILKANPTQAPLSIRETSDLRFDSIEIGKDSPECGKCALSAIDTATDAVLSGEFDALVTAPTSKHAINLLGIPFQGHTERIAERCQSAEIAMMQSATELNLRVAFATTHIPISQITQHLSTQRIINVTRMLHHAICEEGISQPKIAICALNPHAGENGDMGREEIEMILPAIQRLKEEGMDITGPAVPDIIFIASQRQKYDGFVSLYHDQGHIPFKMLAFDCGVNSTLGIPIIRTSPDHGVAYDIAWQNKAQTGSMFAAMRLAIQRAQQRKGLQ